MQESQYITQNDEGIDEVRISGVTGIESPYFPPEIKGPEGLEALLGAQNALEENNPVIVPGYRWHDIRSKPRFKQVKEDIQHLISDHPFIYYEPVELFRYSQPRNLVTYAFQGDQSKSREFLSRIRDGDYEKGLDLIPPFFQAFLERQMRPLLEADEKATVPSEFEDQKTGRIHEGWRDDRADKQFKPYFDAIADDAGKSPNATVIPPVPPILKTSGTDVFRRTLGFNGYMARVCEAKRNEFSGGPVTSYLHFYLDQGIFGPGTDNDEKVKRFLKRGVEELDVAGIALTISNYDKIWNKGYQTQLERFINEISNFARQFHLPVLLPRSKWYGAHLTDHGVQGFSSLMNGNDRYIRRGGGMGEMAKYGTIPVYGAARELNADQLQAYLGRNGGELPELPDLPSKPPTFNTAGSTPKEVFGKATHFRVQFGKQRRLTHVHEAREFREGLKRGNPNPARRYLERSDHELLA